MKQSFIAASSPNQESYVRFWMTVSEQKVGFIVNLTSLEKAFSYYGEKDEFEYWPTDEKQPMELGNGLKIDLVHTEKIGDLLKR